MQRQRSYTVAMMSQYGKTPLEGAFCCHAHRICMRDRLDGFDYCIDHILQDKNAPYKPCNFVSSNSGKKCTRAAPKADKKDGYCKRHARKAAMLRYRASLKAMPKDPGQLVLDELDYYLPNSTESYPDSPVSTIGKLLDYASGSDSDAEPPQLKDIYQGDYDSDAESVDSEPEDALRYAEVYTAEEVALITRDKLIRLQSLYINQFKRLQHLMKEKRREFLNDLKKEVPVYGPNLGQISDSKEKKRLKKLKAMVSYRKRKGYTAILHRKSKNRRIQVTKDYQGPVKETKLPKCTYQSPEDQTQCDRPCVPLVQFCMDHVLMDPNQVLYRRCSKASGVCQRNAVPYAEEGACILHQEIPPYVPRLWKQMVAQKNKTSLGMNPSASTSSLESMDAADAAQLFPEAFLLPGTSKMIGSPIITNTESVPEEMSTPGISDDGAVIHGPFESSGESSKNSSLTDSPSMRDVTLDSLPLLMDDKPILMDDQPVVAADDKPMLTDEKLVPANKKPRLDDEKPSLSGYKAQTVDNSAKADDELDDVPLVKLIQPVEKLPPPVGQTNESKAGEEGRSEALESEIQLDDVPLVKLMRRVEKLPAPFGKTNEKMAGEKGGPVGQESEIQLDDIPLVNLIRPVEKSLPPVGNPNENEAGDEDRSVGRESEIQADSASVNEVIDITGD